MRLRKEQDTMPEEEIMLIANVSDALAHPARINMFRYIMQANRAMVTVCNKDLVEHFDYAQATVSQHMKKLVQSGLIEVKKKDKFSYYYANLGMLMQYLNATLAFVLGHGIITSLVIVFTGFLINKEKIKAVPFISRFLFMFILLGASSALSMAITSWLN